MKALYGNESSVMLQEYRKYLDEQIEEHIKRTIYYLYFTIGWFNPTFICDLIMFVWGVEKKPDSLARRISIIKTHVEKQEREKTKKDRICETEKIIGGGS